jgi:hypothetical protein
MGSFFYEVESHHPLCPFCGDRIGLYEPIIALEPDGRRQSSLASEPSLSEGPATLIHAVCAAIHLGPRNEPE